MGLEPRTVSVAICDATATPRSQLETLDRIDTYLIENDDEEEKFVIIVTTK